MWRTIIVVVLIIIGIAASFYGSFNALMFYLWIAYFRPESWIWSNWVTGLNLSLIVGIFLLISTFITNVKFKFTLFAGLLSMVAVHSLTSSLFSDYSNVAFYYWTEFIKVVAISYLITMLVRSEKDFKITLIVISLSLGMEGAKQGWVQLILSPGTVNNNTHASLGDNNDVAVGMLMIVPVLFALYQTAERKLIKYGFAFLAIGVIYRALSTYSRGGFLTFFTMCIIYWFRSQHKIRTLFVVVLISILLLPLFPQKFWDRMDTITASGEEREGSAAGRLYFWKIGFEMAQNYPLFGIGHNAYREAYDAFDNSGGLYGTKRSVHSAWFGIMSEWGFIGFILFLGIYAYCLFLCSQVRSRCKNNPELISFQIYASCIETSLIAAFVGITFLPFQYREILWHFFALAVANQQLFKYKMAIDDNQQKSVDRDDDL